MGHFMERQRPFLLKFEIFTDTTGSEETKARFRLCINPTTSQIPVTEKEMEGHTYIRLSPNTHLKVVAPPLKCFCTFDVPVAVTNSNTGAADQAMGFARTISISSQSVSPSVRSQIAKLSVPFIRMALALRSQFAVRVTNSILTVRLVQNSYSSWESEIEVKQALKTRHVVDTCGARLAVGAG